MAVLLCNLTSPKLNLGLVFLSLCRWYNEHVVNTADTLSKSLYVFEQNLSNIICSRCLISTGLDTKQGPSSSPFIVPPSLNLLPPNSKHTRPFRQGLCLPHLPCHITPTKPAKIHRVVAARLVLKLFCKFLLLAKSSAQAFQNVSLSLFSTEALLSKKGFNFQHTFYF